MNSYFQPKMNDSYCLFKIAKKLLNNTDDIFNELYQHLMQNNNFKKYCDKGNIVQKNNSYIFLFKMKKELKYIQQIVLQFDISSEDIQYDITIYCKQQMLDNKFYYPIQNILNKSIKTFKNNQNNLLKILKDYFDNVFDKYFQIYEQNVNNGLFV